MRLTRSIPQLLLAAACLTSGLAPALLQDDSPKDQGTLTPPVGEQGYPWNKKSAERNEKLMKQLIGAWELRQIHSPTLNTTLRKETGVLLFTRDYASFELHIGWGDPLGGLADWQFQSGTHKVTLDAQSNLQLTLLVGAAFDDGGVLVFAEPGTTRGYRIEIHKPRLVLTRIDNGDRFEFVRMENPSLDKEADIYGRPPLEEADKADESE